MFLGDVGEVGVLNKVLDTRPPTGGYEVKDKATTPSNADEVKGNIAGARSNEVGAIVLTGIAVDNEGQNSSNVNSSKTTND